MRKMFVFIICAGFTIFGTLSWGNKAHKHRQNRGKSHVHGRGHVDVILLQRKMVVDFKLPARNIVGFERDPKRPEQRKAIAEAVKFLKDHRNVIVIPPAGGCQPSAKTKVVTTTQDREKRNRHTDFQIKYEFSCATPAEVKSIEVLLFKTYKELTHLNSRWVTQDKQLQQDLTPGNSVFKPDN